MPAEFCCLRFVYTECNYERIAMCVCALAITTDLHNRRTETINCTATSGASTLDTTTSNRRRPLIEVRVRVCANTHTHARQLIRSGTRIAVSTRYTAMMMMICCQCIRQQAAEAAFFLPSARTPNAMPMIVWVTDSHVTGCGKCERLNRPAV